MNHHQILRLNPTRTELGSALAKINQLRKNYNLSCNPFMIATKHARMLKCVSDILIQYSQCHRSIYTNGRMNEIGMKAACLVSLYPEHFGPLLHMGSAHMTTRHPAYASIMYYLAKQAATIIETEADADASHARIGHFPAFEENRSRKDPLDPKNFMKNFGLYRP